MPLPEPEEKESLMKLPSLYEVLAKSKGLPDGIKDESEKSSR